MKRESDRSQRLRQGLPLVAVAAVGAAVLVWLALVARDPPHGSVRAYAAVILDADRCTIEGSNSKDVLTCAPLGADTFVVNFRDSLRGSTAFLTRRSCCYGQASAAITDDRAITVRLFGRIRYPVSVSVMAP